MMDKIKEIFAKIQLFMRLDMAMVDKLEELDKRLAAQETSTKDIQNMVKSCESRFSELQYKLSTFLRDHRG